MADYSTVLSQIQQVSYLTTDALGSPRIITDQNGVVTNRKDYAAFGDETITTHRTNRTDYLAPSPTRKDYTGYEKDGESGLEYAQARYYNNQHGRFTSVDPLTASATIRDPQTFNRYSYALNSPYKFTDPLGLMASESGGWTTPGSRSKDCTKGCYINGEYIDADDFLASQQSSENNTAVESNEDDEPPSYENWVVQNVDELEKQVASETVPEYANEEGATHCARLPQSWDGDQRGSNVWRANREAANYRLMANWQMGAAVTNGMALTKGTVLATFNRAKGKYEGNNSGNHTVIFLGWTKTGMKIIEQGPSFKPRTREIPYVDSSSNNYFNNAGAYNVVRVQTVKPQKLKPNFIDNNIRRNTQR